MKAFVSGQLKEKKAVREAYAQLAKMGIGVTHDWTNTDDLGSYSKHSKEASSRAVRDIQGVCEAEFYILLTDNKICGKGMYVELGVALARYELTGSPMVFVVGPMNHASIFYYHPVIRHFPSIDSCIEHIRHAYVEASQPPSRNKQSRRKVA